MPHSNTPHIAVVQRESLRWLPDSPIDTPAEVFSIELGKYFMDLRMYTEGKRSGTVDWAMAGVRQVLDGSTEGELWAYISSQPGTNSVFTTSYPALTHLRFLNIIDYRQLHSEPLPALPPSLVNPEESASPLSSTTPDDVTIQPISPTTYLESGRMPNPDSSDPDTYTPFEEVWQRLSIRSNTPAILIESIGGDSFGKAYFAQVDRWRIGLMDTGAGKFHGWRDEHDGTSWQSIRTVDASSRDVITPLSDDMIERAVEGEILRWAGRDWVVRIKTRT